MFLLSILFNVRAILYSFVDCKFKSIVKYYISFHFFYSPFDLTKCRSIFAKKWSAPLMLVTFFFSVFSVNTIYLLYFSGFHIHLTITIILFTWICLWWDLFSIFYFLWRREIAMNEKKYVKMSHSIQHFQ